MNQLMCMMQLLGDVPFSTAIAKQLHAFAALLAVEALQAKSMVCPHITARANQGAKARCQAGDQVAEDGQEDTFEARHSLQLRAGARRPW